MLKYEGIWGKEYQFGCKFGTQTSEKRARLKAILGCKMKNIVKHNGHLYEESELRGKMVSKDFLRTTQPLPKWYKLSGLDVINLLFQVT
jgi:hypothetical protein